MQRICTRCHFKMLTRGALCAVCGYDKLTTCAVDADKGVATRSAKKSFAQSANVIQGLIEKFCQMFRSFSFKPNEFQYQYELTPDTVPSTADNEVKAYIQTFDPAVPALPMPQVDEVREARRRLSASSSRESTPNTGAADVTEKQQRSTSRHQNNIHQFPVPPVCFGEPEIVTTRRNLAELKDWFENFGKDGILVPRQQQAENTTSKAEAA